MEPQWADDLPPGSCCFYKFPYVNIATDPRPLMPSARGLRLLRLMILALLEATSEDDDLADPVGAFPIHALMVVNTPEVLSLCMDILERAPHQLTRLHTSKLFLGESILHIVIVNRHEELLVKLVELACKKLEREEVVALLHAQAEGLFFRDLPMRWYGGTALAYACSFNMRKAVEALLEAGGDSPILNLNDPKDACRLTGFLPLHAAVANRKSTMFDFLTDSLPIAARADVKAVTRLGQLTSLAIYNLSPLQLAARMGDHAMTRHIMRRQCGVEWIWGSVTQFSMSLVGIDSSGVGGGDIMELIVSVGAGKATTAMLLDDFMNGFIFSFYQRKWAMYGRRIHYVRLMLDSTILICHVLQIIIVKERSPGTSSGDAVMKIESLSIVLLVVVAMAMSMEAWFSFRYARNQNEVQYLGLRRTLRTLVDFCLQHGVHIQLTAYICIAVSALIILSGQLPSSDTFSVTLDWYDPAAALDQGSGALSGRRGLRWAPGPSYKHDTLLLNSWEIVNEATWPILWIIQAAGLLLMMYHLLKLASTPFQAQNILLFTIIKMVQNDLTTFLVAYLWLILACYLAMMTLYPRSGEASLPHILDFNSMSASFFALVDLSLLGEPVLVELLHDTTFHHMSSPQVVSLLACVMVYYGFIVIGTILMLNLLIAMLSDTFNDAREAATLQSRLAFAVAVMKLELVAGALNMKTLVGEPTQDGKSLAFRFRAVESQPNDNGAFNLERHEGNFDEGGLDPFKPPALSHDVRSFEMIKHLSHHISDIKQDIKQAADMLAGAVAES